MSRRGTSLQLLERRAAAPFGDPLAILTQRKPWEGEIRPFHYAYKLAEAHYGQAMTSRPDAILVDEKRMTARIPFADGTRRDRVGDLIEIAGIRTDLHIQNPQGLLDHGKYLHLPIAMCEDRDTGEYTVELAGNVANANLFFLQTDLEHEQGKAAEQVFDLIAKKFLRAGSIGFKPLRAVSFYDNPDSAQPSGAHLITTELIEVSVVVIPANGDAARRIVCLNGVCGKSLSSCILEPMKAYDPGRQTWDTGYQTKSLSTIRHKYSESVASAFRAKRQKEIAYSQRAPENVGKGNEMATTKVFRQVKAAPPNMPADNKLPKPEEAAKAMTDPNMAAGENENDNPQSPEPGDGEKKEKYGAQVLRRIHMDAGILMEDYDEFMKDIEQENVKDHLHSLLEHIQGVMEETESIFQEQYPDLPPLDGATNSSGEGGNEAATADDSEDDDSDDDEETDMATKGFLAKRTKLRKQYKMKMHETDAAADQEPGHKSICPACGKEPCICGKAANGQKCETAMVTKSVFTEDHRNTLGGVSGFLGELGGEAALGQERQEKCMHYHKALKGMMEIKEEAQGQDAGNASDGPGRSPDPQDVAMETKALREENERQDRVANELKARLARLDSATRR